MLVSGAAAVSLCGFLFLKRMAVAEAEQTIEGDVLEYRVLGGHMQI